MRLTTLDHDRGAAGMTYVYPVVSRRAAGVSIGVNLNPDKACNWRCVYCQVPGLTHGKGPEIDLALLERELEAMLDALVNGDYMARHVPPEAQRWNDVALSGDGEPTSSPRFAEAIALAAAARDRHDPTRAVKLVLITNGSLAHQAPVQAGLRALAEAGGEAWFKLDAATDAGMLAVNSAPAGAARALANLRTTAGLCPTWVQTCVFARDGAPPDAREVDAYVEALAGLVADGVPLRGVLLYGLARPSHQPEAPSLSRLPEAWLEALADRLRDAGLDVRVSP